MSNKGKVVIFGGGTFNHVACHLSLAAPAFGGTAKQLHRMFTDSQHELESHLVLTKMADSSSPLVTNDDVAVYVERMLYDPLVRVVVMNAAICDFEMDNPGDSRLSSTKDYPVTLKGIQTKILSTIRKARPEMVVVGFKTTHGASPVEQLAKAAASVESNDLDMVLANDVHTRNNILLTADLQVHQGSRDYLLRRLVGEVLELYN